MWRVLPAFHFDCNMLQFTATHMQYSTFILQHTGRLPHPTSIASHCNALQHTTTYCNTHAVLRIRCNAAQHTLQHTLQRTLQLTVTHTATHTATRTTTCCNTHAALHLHTATHRPFSTLHCNAKRSLLQRIAVRCSKCAVCRIS